MRTHKAGRIQFDRTQPGVGQGGLVGGRLLGGPDLDLFFYYVMNVRAAQHYASFLVPALDERGIFSAEQFQSLRSIDQIPVVTLCFHHGPIPLLKLNFVEYVVVFVLFRSCVSVRQLCASVFVPKPVHQPVAYVYSTR